jgi:magnesium transporter
VISVFTWDEATKTPAWGGPDKLPPPDRIPDCLWIDLEESTEEEEKLVFEKFFPIHTLSLEDVQKLRRDPDGPPHFPKVEEFPDYLFVIVNPLALSACDSLLPRDAGSPPLRACTQLSAVLTNRLLITHHYQPLVTVAALNAYLRKHPANAGRGPDFLFHHVLDEMVDHYAPLLDHVDSALDALEEEVFTNPNAALLVRLLHLKRLIIHLRKTLVHEREVLARMFRGEFALIDDREAVYYRNVYDHLLRFTEIMEASREMVMDLMQTLLASQANKLNEVMKVLTMISVTLLPMSLIAGIYGMNFEKETVWWPSLETTYGMPIALGMMLLSGLGALAFFRWMKWI